VTAGGAVPAARPGFKMVSDLNRIGGWLIMVALGLVIAPFGCLNAIVSDYQTLSGGVFQNSPSQQSPLGNLVVIEIGINAVIIAALLCLNVLFFTKKRAFPGWMIVFLISQLCVTTMFFLAALAVVPSMNGATILATVLRPFLAALIWIPYFRTSKRVKATFVNP
jgi:hypothetical protein